MQLLGLSSDTIIDFKQSEEVKDISEKGEKLIKKLKIKFVFYFILGFLFLLFFCTIYLCLVLYIEIFNSIY